ncbi:MAG TPA: MtrB/PioB family outer membrane beta-barrel protein [Terriglobales bacterium]|nr:MtrB/PioB family outer membrane beta-barrel protein [Terriglobales bacterium]
MRHLYRTLAVLGLLVPLTLWSQDKPPETAAAPTAKAENQPVDTEEPEKGFVEFGVRHIWGDVYGRPDLPFSPDLRTSKFNEYRDVRSGFFVRRARLHLDDVFGANNYLSLQSEKAIYKDQSYLVTLGQYGKFKVQMRYDEIPHVYSNTARTLYVQTAPGVFTIPLALRNTLQGISTSNTMPNIIQTQIVPGMNFITPQILRRAGSGLVSVNLTPGWNLNGSYLREHQSGTRPIGTIINSSPSTALTGGFGAELPEPIDYMTDRVTAGTEFHRDRWGMQVGYLGSFFQNNAGTLTYDNPWRTTDCISACTGSAGPAQGRFDLYPNNHAHYLNLATIVELSPRLHLLANINPGWLRQTDPFIPYSINSLRQAQTGPLPATNLGGDKQTLSMNFTLVARVKDVQLKGTYRHYDYNNNTPIIELTPVIADIAAPNVAAPDHNTHFAYNRKNLDFIGNWYFAKRSSFKAGYEGEWMDRNEHRDVRKSLENAFVTALDLSPTKDMTFRVAYRYAVRNPEEYEDEFFTEISGGIPEGQPDSRRFDEGHRVRNKLESQFTWNVTDRFSFSAIAATLQDDFNLPGGVNRSTPLNFISGTTSPYYIYGLLKDINFNYGIDADFMVNSAATLFAEYSHERYHKRMTSRYRAPGGAAPLPMDCSVSGRACDSPNNDWESAAREKVDIFSLGTDLTFGKRTYVTTFYSLSASTGNVNSRPLGDPTLLTGPNKFVLVTTNAAVDYPQTTHRLHDLGVVFKYKVTKNISPRVEYRYQQNDIKDYQTSAMTPYMGCVSPVPPGAAVPGCTSPLIGTPSSNYPYFVVGDTGAVRYLFLGADQPSYRVHNISFVLEYRF